MTSEHVTTERERALASDAAQRQKLKATGADMRRGRMSREVTGGGEVGGNAREWGGSSSGGAAFIPARGHQCQILVMI